MDATGTKNWMLDEVIETFKQGLNQEELINKLAVQKIEYGRTCIMQFFTMTGGKSLIDVDAYFRYLDSALEERIIELGGTPQVRSMASAFFKK